MKGKERTNRKTKHGRKRSGADRIGEKEQEGMTEWKEQETRLEEKKRRRDREQEGKNKTQERWERGGHGKNYDTEQEENNRRTHNRRE